MTGLAWLLWLPVGRVVGDRDGNLARTRLVAQSQLFGPSAQLLTEAAMNRYDGPGQDPAVGLSRRCYGPDDHHLCWVLEAVVLVRPDPSPAGGWGR